MNELLQTVLDNPAARGEQAISLAAAQSAAEFGPWGTVAE